MLIYVAAPYSSVPNKAQLMREISKICGEYMKDHPHEFMIPGLIHHYATLEVPDLGTDYNFWGGFCEDFLTRCDKVAVLKFPGWQESKGVMGEIQKAEEHGLPIMYLDVVLPEDWGDGKSKDYLAGYEDGYSDGWDNAYILTQGDEHDK